MDQTDKERNEDALERETAGQSSQGESSVPEVEKLRRELESKDREARENYDRLLRMAADLENFKKRMAREKEELIRYGNEALIKDLLPVLDNLERAVEHARGGGNGKPLLEGVEMVLKGFLDALTKHGVTRIAAKGESFDPEKHEAIAQVESKEHEPNSVVEEHHKGYYLFDRLLRPVLVSVAKPPEAKKGENERDREVENGGGDD